MNHQRLQMAFMYCVALLLLSIVYEAHSEEMLPTDVLVRRIIDQDDLIARQQDEIAFLQADRAERDQWIAVDQAVNAAAWAMLTDARIRSSLQTPISPPRLRLNTPPVDSTIGTGEELVGRALGETPSRSTLCNAPSEPFWTWHHRAILYWSRCADRFRHMNARDAGID